MTIIVFNSLKKTSLYQLLYLYYHNYIIIGAVQQYRFMKNKLFHSQFKYLYDLTPHENNC
jgi:hypothetical protein